LKRKIIIILSVLFIIFMAALFVYYLIKGDSSRWQVAVGGIVVSALPLFLLFMKNNPFNIPILIAYYLFIFCTIFLGSIAGFYLRFKWWDSPLHFYKGILVGFFAIVIYKQLIPEQMRHNVSRWIIFLFVLSLSVTAGVIWEIYEFIGDQTFTHTMQLGGNTDTMVDLICGTAGGLLTAVYSVFRR
jgi:peptidoglycan/LPS O-acetylase OafA/YrhL